MLLLFYALRVRGLQKKREREIRLQHVSMCIRQNEKTAGLPIDLYQLYTILSSLFGPQWVFFLLLLRAQGCGFSGGGRKATSLLYCVVI
jgi:hypothetical protein